MLCTPCSAFGPKFCGPNLLISRVHGMQSYWTSLHITVPATGGEPPAAPAPLHDVIDTRPEDTLSASASSVGDVLSKRAVDLRGAIVSGYQLATAAGPLCAEPMWGTCVFVEAVEVLLGALLCFCSCPPLTLDFCRMLATLCMHVERVIVCTHA